MAATVFPQLCHKCDRRVNVGETVYQPSKLETDAHGKRFTYAPPVVVCCECGGGGVRGWTLTAAVVVSEEGS